MDVKLTFLIDQRLPIDLRVPLGAMPIFFSCRALLPFCCHDGAAVFLGAKLAGAKGNLNVGTVVLTDSSCAEV